MTAAGGVLKTRAAIPCLACATGSGLSYQWSRNGVAVGASSSSLTVDQAQYADAGIYFVRATDSYGASVDSADARLHVNSTPFSGPAAGADNYFPILGQSVETKTGSVN